MESKVIKCICAHEYQDKTYGKGMRLHNPGSKNGSTIYRCTVCGNIKGNK